MLAKAVPALPEGDGWLFDPKWDGFRTIVFRDGDEVVLGSRNEKPMTRYFPELVEALRLALPERCVVDGEIVVSVDGVLEFDRLQDRIHPADSRVRMLAERQPATFIAFDLLALGDEDVRRRPLVERRALLTHALEGCETRSAGAVHVTPATTDRAVAADWFVRFEGAGLDGMIAKSLDGVYVENKRVMLKIKHQRTADCAVAAFRLHKDSTDDVPLVGSLVLGLFNHEGQLQHVGVTASFTMARRRELVDELAPWRNDAWAGHPWAEWAARARPTGVVRPGEHQSEAEERSPTVAGQPARAEGDRSPGGQSRWNAKKDLSFEPVRLGLVCEVAYDHMQDNRFRHATTFKRWRPDREPHTCTYDQLEEALPSTLADVLSN